MLEQEEVAGIPLILSREVRAERRLQGLGLPPHLAARLSRNLSAYLLLVPALVFLGVVFVYPMIELIPMSLERIAIGQTKWVGLSNFSYLLFSDRIARTAALNNLKLLTGIPIILVLAVVIAVCLYERVRGTGFYQTVVLLPYLLSIPVVGLVMSSFLTLDGALNSILRSLGLDALALDWLGSAKLALWSVLAVIIWRELGMGVSFFLAQLLTLDEELFDAAKVDGASWLQQVLYVSIPQLRGIATFYAIYLVITLFSWTFGYVFVMTNGGPGFATTVLELAIYRYAIDKRMPSMAAALSLLLFIGMLGFVFAQFRLRQGSAEET